MKELTMLHRMRFSVKETASAVTTVGVPVSRKNATLYCLTLRTPFCAPRTQLLARKLL